MNLRYLATAEAGLFWMRRYFREHPQLDAQKTVFALTRAEDTLRDNPFAGARYEDSDRIRAYPLQGTVFSFLYTVSDNTVWIIDVHDQRGYRNAGALRHFTAELQKRMQDAS